MSHGVAFRPTLSTPYSHIVRNGLPQFQEHVGMPTTRGAGLRKDGGLRTGSYPADFGLMLGGPGALRGTQGPVGESAFNLWPSRIDTFALMKKADGDGDAPGAREGPRSAPAPRSALGDE